MFDHGRSSSRSTSDHSIPRDRRHCGLGANGREHLYNTRPKIVITLAMHSQILFYNCTIQSSTHSNSQNSKAHPMLSPSAQQQESPSILPSTPQKPFNQLTLKEKIRKTKAAQSSSSGISPQQLRCRDCRSIYSQTNSSRNIIVCRNF